ncbi:MAG: hypothetical protein AAFV93_12400, partial [Chloroflexota bacterium]
VIPSIAILLTIIILDGFTSGSIYIFLLLLLDAFVQLWCYRYLESHKEAYYTLMALFAIRILWSTVVFGLTGTWFFLALNSIDALWLFIGMRTSQPSTNQKRKSIEDAL